MTTTNNATTEAVGTAAEPVFPPFDPATFSSTLVWLALTFGALYLIMSRVALPRVEHILKNRSESIHEDMRAAFAMREDAEKASAGYNKTLADAKARSHALAQETRARIKQEQETKRLALEADLNGKLEVAELQIAERKAAAMASVGQIANEAAAAIIQQVTGKPADEAALAVALVEAKA